MNKGVHSCSIEGALLKYATLFVLLSSSFVHQILEAIDFLSKVWHGVHWPNMFPHFVLIDFFRYRSKSQLKQMEMRR